MTPDVVNQSFTQVVWAAVCAAMRLYFAPLQALRRFLVRPLLRWPFESAEKSSRQPWQFQARVESELERLRFAVEKALARSDAVCVDTEVVLKSIAAARAEERFDLEDREARHKEFQSLIARFESLLAAKEHGLSGDQELLSQTGRVLAATEDMLAKQKRLLEQTGEILAAIPHLERLFSRTGGAASETMQEASSWVRQEWLSFIEQRPSGLEQRARWRIYHSGQRPHPPGTFAVALISPPKDASGIYTSEFMPVPLAEDVFYLLGHWLFGRPHEVSGQSPAIVLEFKEGRQYEVGKAPTIGGPGVFPRK